LSIGWGKKRPSKEGKKKRIWQHCRRGKRGGRCKAPLGGKEKLPVLEEYMPLRGEGKKRLERRLKEKKGGTSSSESVEKGTVFA